MTGFLPILGLVLSTVVSSALQPDVPDAPSPAPAPQAPEPAALPTPPQAPQESTPEQSISPETVQETAAERQRAIKRRSSSALDQPVLAQDNSIVNFKTLLGG